MPDVKEYYAGFSDNHIMKHVRNNTIHKISRSWVESSLLDGLKGIQLPLADKKLWYDKIVHSELFDALWISYGNQLNLSIGQTVGFRTDEFRDRVEAASSEDGGSPSRALSIGSSEDDTDDGTETSHPNINDAFNPVTLSPLHAARQELSVIVEESSEFEESSEYESESEPDSDVPGYNLHDAEGYAFQKGSEGYEATKKANVEARASEKAAKLARKVARWTEQPVQEHEEAAQLPKPTSAESMQPEDNQMSDAEPAMSAVKKGKRPMAKKQPAKPVGRPTTMKSRKPAPTIPAAKVRSLAASRSRANTPTETPSRATTPNVQTRSRANTPAVEEYGAASAAEASNPRKRSLDSLFEDSEPEELVQHRQEPVPKKMRKTGTERPTTGGKGPAASGGKKAQDGTEHPTTGGKGPAASGGKKEQDGTERPTTGGKRACGERWEEGARWD